MRHGASNIHTRHGPHDTGTWKKDREVIYRLSLIYSYLEETRPNSWPKPRQRLGWPHGCQPCTLYLYSVLRTPDRPSVFVNSIQPRLPVASRLMVSLSFPPPAGAQDAHVCFAIGSLVASAGQVGNGLGQL